MWQIGDKPLNYLFSLISTGIGPVYKLHTRVVVQTFLYHVNPEVDLSCKICQKYLSVL